MKLSHKNILLISPEPWNHIFVSKHHYTTHLAKRGNNVFFLNPPTDRKEVIATTYENVWQVNYKVFPKGMRYYPNMLQQYFIKRKFKELQGLCGVQFDTVWSFDTSVFYDFSALPSKVLKICHIVDLNQDFQTAKAAKTADICFGVISGIVERLKKFNSNTHLISHGVQEFLINEKDVKLPGLNKVKALYIGNLGMRHIDWEILLKIASNHSNVDYVFIGANHEIGENIHKKRLRELAHVFFMEKISASTIPQYLNAADILLLTYKPDYSDDCATPHKMMEYLASGKMIVATQTLEYRQLVEDGLFLMTNKNKEFPQLFQKAVANLTHWNNEEMQSARRAFALDNTYDKQIDRIESIINSYEGAFG